MERSDDVGYDETARQGSSHEEATDSRPDHAEIGSRVAAESLTDAPAVDRRR